MKCFCKRAVSFLTVAAILITLFSGLFQVSAATYSYNTGTREELCTALSDAALDYYTGNYTYEKLSKLSPDTLRTTLRSLVTNGRKTVGYGGLRDYHKYTDANQGSSSKLVLFYCNGIANSAWDQGKTWNREHMWPDSLGGSAMEGDLHAMRPTDPNLNSTRGNKLYGEVTNGSAAKASSTNKNLLGGYSGNNTYEPLDFAKGDCARVVLYDYVVTASMSSVTKVFTDLDTLLSWCLLDPVDTFEMSRNDVAQEIENCRNPFVDYPELAWILFGKEVPAGMSTPSGSASADPCTHEKTHEVVSEATCTKDGLVVTVCDACDEIIATETIAKLGHEYEMTTVQPTCTEKGYDLYECIRCDDSYKKNYTDLVDHIDADGNYACDYCGLEMIPTCLHENTHDVTTEATCTSNGKIETICDDCGVVVATETIAKLGHEYEMTTVQPTCTEKGYDLYECIRCDDSYPENYTDIVDHIDADGDYACDYCGLEMIPTCQHENTFESVYEPNCTDDGMIVVICEACGCVVDKITIEKLGHEYAITTIAPTCSSKGYDLYVCIRCEDTYKKNYTSVVDHNYEKTTVAPTCTEEGYDLYTCTYCGNSYTENYTAVVDHTDSDSNNACDFCGKEMKPAEELPCPCEQFTDVPEKIWYHNAVVYALNNGLMNGVGDGKFDPEGSVTRAMLVTILYRSEGQPSVEGLDNPFTDLPAGKWYTNAVIWAASEGIVNGVTATTFAPDNAITREQIAAILYRYDGQNEVAGSLSSFPDHAAVSKYAVKAMTWAVENGIINGISGNLAPTATATRAQLATMLMRYLEK